LVVKEDIISSVYDGDGISSEGQCIWTANVGYNISGLEKLFIYSLVGSV
jgi:hypothetical protein